MSIQFCRFYPSVEWDILSVPAERHERFYPCCEVRELIALSEYCMLYLLRVIFNTGAISGHIFVSQNIYIIAYI